MDITVTKMEGESHTLKVNPQDTVGSLKKHIKDKFGIDPHMQKLVFVNGQSRIHLSDDSKLVSSYGLQSGSQVSLLVTQPVPEPEPAPFQVFLSNLQGQKSTYDIKPGETVENFKKRVEYREGVKVSQQRLVYQSREMMDGKLLADYNIEALGTINMTSRLRGGFHHECDYHHAGREVPYPDRDPGSLKKHIKDKFGIDPHMQKLVFVNGQRTHLSDDSKPVSSYGLQSGSQVSLLVTQPAPFQVFLSNVQGQKSTYDIKPGETVGNFKKRVESREGVKVSQQRLVYKSREMKDDKLLADYNIEALGTINMTCRLRGG